MACLPKPKIKPPAAEPAPASQGADELKVGADDAFSQRNRGAVGRLALRVGRSSNSSL